MREERIKFLDEAGIEAEVIYATLLSTIMHAANLPHNRDMVRAAVQVYNDWMAQFCSLNPDRLLGVGAATTDDPVWAARELERIRNKGLRGIMINIVSQVGCPPYRSEIYDPIWASAQDTDTPITLHIVTGRVRDAIHVHTKEENEDAPATLFDLFAEVKRPLANDFIFGGILDRFPRLKIVCSEFEVNWIPGFMWGLDQIQGAFASRMDLPKLELKASDYMRSRIWHGIVNDPFANHAIPYVGAKQVCWGSDFPHARSIGTNAQDFCADLFKEFPQADQEALVGGNIAEVYGLG
jgi:predicted TIM-barrel fold metal-dependent hydrolase